MIDQTQKLEKFKQAVFDDADAKAAEIVNEAKAECDKRISEAKREAQENISRSKAEADEQFNIRELRESSSGNLQSRKVVLRSREDMIDRVFDNVRAQLEDYRKTADYEALMVKRAQEAYELYPDKKGEVRISPKDSALKDKLTLGGKFTVSETKSIITGGIMVVYADDNLALDFTFDNELANSRKGFAGRAGLLV